MPRSKYKKRSDGRYYRQIKIGFTPEGKPKYKGIYARTQSELDRKCSEFISLKNKGIIVDDHNLTVKNWAEIWLNTYKQNVKPSTRDMYKYVISKHLKPIQDVSLSALKAEQVQAILNTVKPRTQQKVLLTIRQILKQAVDNDYIYKNVAANVKAAQMNATPRRSLTSTEIKEIFALDLPDMTRVFLGVILYCGLRRGEAWALSRADIDETNHTITVNHSVTLSPSLAITSPKTKASKRTVGIPDALWVILRPYLTDCPMMIFHGASGSLMTDREYRKMWNNFICVYNESKGGKNMGSKSKSILAISPDITPHLFRHTYATMLYHAGVDIKTAQYLLGHSTLEMTLKIYTHLDDSDKRKAVQKLDEFLVGNNA